MKKITILFFILFFYPSPARQQRTTFQDNVLDRQIEYLEKKIEQQNQEAWQLIGIILRQQLGYKK